MLFSIVRLRARCSRTSCTLRSSSSSFSAFAVCSLASHLFASKKSSFKTYNQAQLRLCFFLCQAARVLLTYFVYAPLRMLAFRDFRRLLCVCLSLVVRLWRGAHVLRVRSAPRPRLSRLLPFALWQDTSLQAKKQCSRRTNKHGIFAVLFLCQAVGEVLTCLCTFRALSSSFLTCAPCFVFGQRLTRDTVPPFAIFNACSAPDYLFVSNTLRASFSSFSALAVCSLARHLFASKKAVFKTYNKSTAICRAF